MARIFTHFPQILHSTSLPCFAHGGQAQQTELNQTLRHMLGSEPFANACQKFHRCTLQKNLGTKTAYFVTVLISTKLYQMTKHRAGVFTHLP